MAAPGPGDDPSLGPGERSAEGGEHFSDLPRRRKPADGMANDDPSVPWDETERQAVGRAEEQRRQAEREELDRLLAERQDAIARAEADERAAFSEDAARMERARFDREMDDSESGYTDPSEPGPLAGLAGLESPEEFGVQSDLGTSGVSREGRGPHVSTGSAVRSGTITVVPKVAGELQAADGPTTSKLGWLVTVLLVALALGLAWTLFRIAGGDGDEQASTDNATTEEADTAALTGAALEIFPQRAVVGESLAVSSKGSGCAPDSIGILTIRAVDDGLADPAGRLIGQRTVKVNADGNWQSTPMLIGEPAGTYWLTSTCAKSGASGNANAVLQNGSQGDVVEMLRTSDPQQLLKATQVLEITGPVKVLAVNLTPEIALAGSATNVLLQGDQCPGSRVDGVATGPNGERVTYVATVDRDGAWNVTVPLPVTANAGSYRFVSRCDTGAQYATRTVALVAERVPTVRDVTTSGTVSVSTPTLQGLPIAQPATPIPADANFTG